MIYLLFVPATVAMLAAMLFYASAALFEWPTRIVVLLGFAGLTFQFAAIYTVGLIDR